MKKTSTSFSATLLPCCLLFAASLLAGCGAAETAAVAATQAELAAEQAKQAKEAQEKIERDLAAAQKAAADARTAAEQ